MKFDISVTICKIIEIPSVEEIQQKDVPEPYSVEEWHEQLKLDESLKIAGGDIREIDHWWAEPIIDNN